jgi:hypothetical protein
LKVLGFDLAVVLLFGFVVRRVFSTADYGGT